MNALLDEAQFATLTSAHRPELLRHCYRMLGSVGEAEDQVQETLLRAWQHRDGFRGESSARTWLFRIATNGCLNAIEHRSRRMLPEDRQPASALGEPIASRLEEPIWLEPYPDARLSADVAAERRERIGLAFVAALQGLPARQRAILLLRDVVDCDAKDVAALLDTSVGSVESALLRARRSIADRPVEPTAQQLGPDDRVLLARYVSAWEGGDVGGLVKLLREDAVLSMPPIPSWFQGRAAIQCFFETSPRLRELWGDGLRLLPTTANGCPAFGVYRGAGEGGYVPHSLMVTALSRGEVTRITTFLTPALFRSFALPPKLS